MSPFLSFVRRLRPVDVLLPIGAALISAGLQNLADRETRQRARLAELAELANDHLAAIAAAGVRLPDGLVATEEHPLDPEVPWLAQYASPEQEETGPEEQRRRRWKLAALGLAAVTGVTLWNHRGEIAERFREQLVDDVLAEPDGSTFNEPSSGIVCGLCTHPLEHHGKFSCAGDETTDCGCTIGMMDGTEPVRPNWPNAGRETPAAPWPTCLPDGLGVCANKIHGHGPENYVQPVGEPAAVSAELVDELPAVSVTPREACGWPNCDWTSTPTKSEQGQATQAAVHRNRCIYRPAGAGVTPA